MIGVLISHPCSAMILETDTIAVVAKELEKADQDTLVIFDVDDVLMAPTDEFAFRPLIRKNLYKALKANHSKKELEILTSAIFQKRTVQMVNPKVIDIIDNLKQRKILTTALTSWWTGKYGKISKMEDLRFKGLNEIGISFISLSPFKMDKAFPDIPTPFDVPMIKNGIIITSCGDKGLVLKAALNDSHLKIKKIIFIDDQLSQLHSVEKICQDLGIEFTGIYYTEVLSIPLPKLDEQKEKARFEILEKEGVWLLDKELDQKLACKESA